jgi:uncharacterized protein (TIGR02186 family)
MNALRAGLLVLVIVAALAPWRPAHAQALIADLSDHLIAITAGFSGTKVLLFGAIEGDGDIVVVLRGPPTTTVVRRKARVAGIWINSRQVTFSNVPALYYLSSSRPLTEVTTPSVRQRHQIGVENLRVQTNTRAGEETIAEFRAGLIRNKTNEGLFSVGGGEVSFLGQRLFRTEIYLPPNVPPGSYTVETLLLRGGQVAAAQTTPMIVSKVGVGAEVYEFAHFHAASYGILAVILAVLAGWTAGAVRRA